MCVWSYLTLCNGMDHRAPLFMEFSRQEYWSGLSFPTPGDLSDPGIEPASLVPPTLAGGFTTEPLGKPQMKRQPPTHTTPCFII